MQWGRGGDVRMSERVVVLQLEFACAYHRLTGKRVLFPQGFHCTGMPIKVQNCAGTEHGTELYTLSPSSCTTVLSISPMGSPLAYEITAIQHFCTSGSRVSTSKCSMQAASHERVPSVVRIVA